MNKIMQFELDSLNRMKKNALLEKIDKNATKMNFDMCSNHSTGALLSVLASTKPSARILEIGSGLGYGIFWLLNGMDSKSKLISIENNFDIYCETLKLYKKEKRLKLIHGDAKNFILKQKKGSFDIIFADAYPGKYIYLKETLKLLKPGGMYIADDMLAQKSWPDDHYPLINKVYKDFIDLKKVNKVGINWSSGLVLITNRGKK